MAPALSLPVAGAPRLSIVVLPFVNHGGDIGRDDFVDGITKSLTTDLSRIPGAYVISSNTAFTYKGKTIAARSVSLLDRWADALGGYRVGRCGHQ
jgi:TolB-like protein